MVRDTAEVPWNISHSSAHFLICTHASQHKLLFSLSIDILFFWNNISSLDMLHCIVVVRLSANQNIPLSIFMRVLP